MGVKMGETPALARLLHVLFFGFLSQVDPNELLHVHADHLYWVAALDTRWLKNIRVNGRFEGGTRVLARR